VTATQDEAEPQEIPVTFLVESIAEADAQVPELWMAALPPLATATQKDVLTHDTPLIEAVPSMSVDDQALSVVHAPVLLVRA
jgi:hypothetical protein